MTKIIRYIILATITMIYFSSCRQKISQEEVDRYAYIIMDYTVLKELKSHSHENAIDSLYLTLKDSFHAIHNISESEYKELLFRIQEDSRLSSQVYDRVNELFRKHSN